MAEFINNDLTDRGRALLAGAQTGAVFQAVSIVLGSGNMPSGRTPASMTAVVTPWITLDINKVERTGDGNVIYGGSYSNADLTEDTYLREIGMFARLYYPETDTYSDTVLYSYGNAGNTADLIPAYGPGQFVERQMNLVTYIGNEDNVTIQVQSGLTVSRDEIGQPGGVAGLDESAKIPEAQLPDAFVKRSGDTMEGRLWLGNGEYNGYGCISSNRDEVYIVAYQEANDLDSRNVHLRMHSLSDGRFLQDVLVLGETTYGKFYHIFGEHNLDLMRRYFAPAAVYDASVE